MCVVVGWFYFVLFFKGLEYTLGCAGLYSSCRFGLERQDSGLEQMLYTVFFMRLNSSKCIYLITGPFKPAQLRVVIVLSSLYQHWPFFWVGGRGVERRRGWGQDTGMGRGSQFSSVNHHNEMFRRRCVGVGCLLWFCISAFYHVSSHGGLASRTSK